jgi:hypothetical protein
MPAATSPNRHREDNWASPQPLPHVTVRQLRLAATSRAHYREAPVPHRNLSPRCRDATVPAAMRMTNLGCPDDFAKIRGGGARSSAPALDLGEPHFSCRQQSSCHILRSVQELQRGEWRPRLGHSRKFGGLNSSVHKSWRALDSFGNRSSHDRSPHGHT